jgi:hypothetical protein
MTIHLWIDIKPLSQSKELDWSQAQGQDQAYGFSSNSLDWLMVYDNSLVNWHKAIKPI